MSIADMQQGSHLLEAFNGGFAGTRRGDPPERQCADKLVGFSASYNIHATGWAVP